MQLWQDFQQAGISVRRLGDILNTPAEPSLRAERSALPRMQGRVTFEHVSFRYRPDAGEVLDVSNDAVSLETLGLVYAMRVRMDRSLMQVGDKLVNLTPGMAVTVEVKTGRRRLIAFFLSPLLRYQQESIKER